MKVYAVRDKRTNEYQQPVVFPHVAEVVRFFEDICRNQQSHLAKWPLDYQLDQLGEYEPKTGTFKNEWKEVCQILDLIPQEKRSEVKEPTHLVS